MRQSLCDNFEALPLALDSLHLCCVRVVWTEFLPGFVRNAYPKCVHTYIWGLVCWQRMRARPPRVSCWVRVAPMRVRALGPLPARTPRALDSCGGDVCECCAGRAPPLCMQCRRVVGFAEDRAGAPPGCGCLGACLAVYRLAAWRLALRLY